MPADVPADFARLPSVLSLPFDLLTFYETRTHVIVVATNALKEDFRILQFTKSNTKLSYVFDPSVYRRDQAVAYVNRMKGLEATASSSANPNGSLLSSGKARGIIGFVRFLKGYYMLLIKDRRLVTRLGPHAIYEVQDVTYVSLCEPAQETLFSKLRTDDEDRYLNMFKQFDLKRYFYYSDTYDLTNTLQTNMTRPHNVMRGWERKARSEVEKLVQEVEEKRLQRDFEEKEATHGDMPSSPTAARRSPEPEVILPSSIRDAPSLWPSRRSKYIWNYFLLLPTNDTALFGEDGVGVDGKPLGSAETYDSTARRAAEWRAWVVPLIHGCISEAELNRTPCPRTNPDGSPTTASGYNQPHYDPFAPTTNTNVPPGGASAAANGGSAMNKMPIKVLLIGRSSKQFAGTRYLKRGINGDGYVANHVEVEQIAYDPSTLSKCDTLGAFSSFVQVRGSVPVSWFHPPVNRPKPPIVIGFNEALYGFTRKHMEDLVEDFGSPIVVVNLLKSAKAERKKSREKFLSEEYKKALLTLASIAKPANALTNHPVNVEVSEANDDGSITHLLAIPPEKPNGTDTRRRPKRKLFATDFAPGEEERDAMMLSDSYAEFQSDRGPADNAARRLKSKQASVSNSFVVSGNNSYSTAAAMVAAAAGDTDGSMASSAPSGDSPSDPNTDFSTAPAHIRSFSDVQPLSLPWRLLQYVEFDLRNSSDKAWNCMTSIAEARIPQVGLFSCDANGAVQGLQCGVLRSNCVDCIDRTNLGQFFFGLHAIGAQLKAIGVVKDPIDTCHSQSLSELVLELYLRLGDAIAIQYGGSAQVGAGLLHRGLGWDKIMGIRRLYTNLLVDKDRQQVTNVFLGLYTPMFRKEEAASSSPTRALLMGRGCASPQSTGRYGAISAASAGAIAATSPNTPATASPSSPVTNNGNTSSNANDGGANVIEGSAKGKKKKKPEKMQIPFQVHYERNFLGMVVNTTVDTERYIDIAELESDYYLHTSAPEPMERPERDWWREPLIAFHRRRDPYFGTEYSTPSPLATAAINLSGGGRRTGLAGKQQRQQLVGYGGVEEKEDAITSPVKNTTTTTAALTTGCCVVGARSGIKVRMPYPPSFILVDHNGLIGEQTYAEMDTMASQVYTSIRIGLDEGVYEIERPTPADANDVKLSCTIYSTDINTTHAHKRSPFLNIDHRPIQRLSQSALVLNPDPSFVTQKTQLHDFSTFAESVKESFFKAEEDKYHSLSFWQGPAPPKKYKWNFDDPSQNRTRKSLFAPHPTQLAEAYKGTKSTVWEWRHKRMSNEEVQFLATSIYHHGSPLDNDRDWSCEHLLMVIRGLDPEVPDEYLEMVHDAVGYNTSVYFLRVVKNDWFGPEYQIYTDNLHRILNAVHGSLTPMALLMPPQDSVLSVKEFLENSSSTANCYGGTQQYLLSLMDPAEKLNYQLEATVVDYGDDGKPKVIPRPPKHYVDAIPEVSPYWTYTEDMREMLCKAVSSLRLIQPTVSTFSRFIDPPLDANNIEEVLVRLVLELTHLITGIPLSNSKRFCRGVDNPFPIAVPMLNVFTMPVFTSWIEENSAACGLRFHRMLPRRRLIAIRQFADLLVNSGIMMKMDVPSVGDTGISIPLSLARDYEDEGVLFSFANINGRVALNVSPNGRDTTMFLKESRAVELSLLVATTALAILKNYEDFLTHSNGRDRFRELPRLTAVTVYLQGADITTLCVEERVCFFINVYNALYIHAWIHAHLSTRPIPMVLFYQTMCYSIGNHLYSLHDIKHGILRGNTPSSLMLFPQFLLDDSRKVLSVGFINELTGRIVYALIDTYVVHERANFVNSYTAGAKKAPNDDFLMMGGGMGRGGGGYEDANSDDSNSSDDDDGEDENGNLVKGDGGENSKGRSSGQKESNSGRRSTTSARRIMSQNGVSGDGATSSSKQGGGGLVGAAARVLNDVPWMRNQRKTAEAANICRPMDPATLYKQLNELEIQFAYRTMGWALPGAKVQQANAMSEYAYGGVSSAPPAASSSAQAASSSASPRGGGSPSPSSPKDPRDRMYSTAFGDDGSGSTHPNELPPEIVALRAVSASSSYFGGPQQFGGPNGNLLSCTNHELSREEKLRIVQPLSGLEEFGAESEDILTKIERIAQSHHDRRHKIAAQRKQQAAIKARAQQQREQHYNYGSTATHLLGGHLY